MRPIPLRKAAEAIWDWTVMSFVNLFKLSRDNSIWRSKALSMAVARSLTISSTTCNVSMTAILFSLLLFAVQNQLEPQQERHPVFRVYAQFSQRPTKRAAETERAEHRAR